MNKQVALKQLQSPAILDLAFDYALFDRQNKDHFCDFSELEAAQENKEQWLAELAAALEHPENYEPTPAFAYLMPKNRLCERRLIYLPLRDLVLRYAFSLVLAETLEHQLIETCFANRRATGEDAKTQLTEYFATGGWPRFCEWQKNEAERHSVLIKTDISSFYDSVCQDYFLEALAHHLKWPLDAPLLRLFARLLQVPIVYTAAAQGQCLIPRVMQHGLLIGSSVEGYFTNLYLNEVDQAMRRLGASYGRYVDDICIFADSEEQARLYLHELQASLLPLGLNLNASKTRLVDKENEPQAFAESLDRPLQQQSRFFNEGEDFNWVQEGKDFCKFMSARNAEGKLLLPLKKRTEWHVEQLLHLLFSERTAVKHAVWLLVQTAIYRQVPLKTRHYTRDFIIDLLADERTNDYVKCRCLHHLVKPRKKKDGSHWRYIDAFNTTQNKKLMDLLPQLLAAQGMELKLMAVYLAADYWNVKQLNGSDSFMMQSHRSCKAP
ncbi:MAG: RNA-directed DNA polymerase, partial [Methyloprofundus sp.]|nr:RNA-directed DNA polymerase [Methyloprofundus sp.]